MGSMKANFSNWKVTAMIKVNDLILEKINKHDKKVIALAKKALELSAENPEHVVAEQLESIVRKLVKEDTA